MTFAKIALATTLLLAAVSDVQAQSVIDGSDNAVGAERTAVLLVLIGRYLRSSDAKIAGLHQGKAGALCGTVDVKNRMGTYTGPRGFVADLADDFVRRLPEGPEMRSPASMADFQAMQRAKKLFGENCTGS